MTTAGYQLEFGSLVPYLAITYQNTMNSEQFREAQHALLELITANKAQKLFIDMSDMALISPTDRVWVVTDWFTAAVKAGLIAIAGVAPKNSLVNLIMEEPLLKIGQTFGIQLRWFSTRAEALAWLEAFPVTAINTDHSLPQRTP